MSNSGNTLSLTVIALSGTPSDTMASEPLLVVSDSARTRTSQRPSGAA
jgi:hypothetical protein